MTKPIPPEIDEPLKRYLTAIAKLFRAPRITLIIRSADNGNTQGDLVMSQDDRLDKVIEVLTIHRIAEARRFAAEGERSGQPGAEFPHRRNIDELPMKERDDGR